MRRTSRPPIPLPSGRLCTKPVRSESVKRRRRPAAPRGRCRSSCRHTTMWCTWPSILPPRDGGSARTAGTSSSGRTAKTTLRAWPRSSPVTAALMRIRPSGSGGLIYIHPGVTVAPLLAAFLDPGRLRVLRPALRARGLDINMATRKKHTPEQVVRKLATADREPRRDKYTTWTAPPSPRPPARWRSCARPRTASTRPSWPRAACGLTSRRSPAARRPPSTCGSTRTSGCRSRSRSAPTTSSPRR